MPNFWRVVNKVISDADVLLLLLDARLVDETRHKEVENKVKWAEKPLIFVITKCDLVEKEKMDAIKKTLKPCVFVSAKEFHGLKILRDRILIEAKRAFPQFKRYRIGVLGYPNVGKSSLINAIKGKRSASTSAHSGHTKGVQHIRADNLLLFLDSPGVIPYKERNLSKHALIGTVDYHRVADPDIIVLRILEKVPGKLQTYFGVEGEGEEFLVNLAQKKHLLGKGNAPNIERCARMILKLWQEGKII